MYIRSISSTLDGMLGPSPLSVPNEREPPALLVNVTQDPRVSQVQEFMSGRVPEKGTNIVDLINKMVF